MKLSFVIGGWVLAVAMASCGTTFIYRYYGLGPDVPFDGTLLGPKPKDDRPFRECKPDEQEQGKCVVLFTDEYERLYLDRIECAERLKGCEEQCQN